MSDTVESPLDDPGLFIANCREFFRETMKECERIKGILSKHPSSPEPAEDPALLSDESISDTVSRLSKLSDEDDLALVSKESPEKSSRRHQARGEKIKSFFVKEYEKLCQLGSKLKKATDLKPPFTPKTKQADKYIVFILTEIGKIKRHLEVFNQTIDGFEKSIMDANESPETRLNNIKFLESVQTILHQFHQKYVVQVIHKHKHVRDYIESEAARRAADERETADAPSTPKKLRGRASSKAPLKHSSKAGPSTASQKGNVLDEPSTSKGTPKRTKTRSVSRQEKKKKVSPKPESKSESTGQGTFFSATDKKSVHYFSSSESSDADSRTTDSSKLDSSVKDLDIS